MDYRLPKIVQCANEDVVEYLKQQGLGKDPLGWDQMVGKKFIISVDGNGATCGRVALALRSNSVLLKYVSNYNLYYFHAMVSWLHYIPIYEDGDVIDVVSKELLSEGKYEHIASAGRSFASEYLNKSSVFLYIGLLLRAYSQIFNDQQIGEGRS